MCKLNGSSQWSFEWCLIIKDQDCVLWVISCFNTNVTLRLLSFLVIYFISMLENVTGWLSEIIRLHVTSLNNFYLIIRVCFPRRPIPIMVDWNCPRLESSPWNGMDVRRAIFTNEQMSIRTFLERSRSPGQLLLTNL